MQPARNCLQHNMLKWTATAQQPPVLPRQRQLRRQRRATIANKENIPLAGYNTSTPMLRNSPLVLAPLSDIHNITPEAQSAGTPRRLSVQHVHYAATLPRGYEEEYSPSASHVLPSSQHLALRGLLPLDPFIEQPRYIAAASSRPLKQRKLDADFVAVMEPPKQQQTQPPAAAQRAATPQHSGNMGDQTLDKLIDAILDSARKADASTSKKKSRKSFNLRRRTLVKQQLESTCAAVLSPSYAPGDDPASDLSFALLPLPLSATPEPATPLQLRHSLLLQLPTPTPAPAPAAESSHSNTFCLETPVRPPKRRRRRHKQQPLATERAAARESPLKRYKVDSRNYFEVGLALPSSIYV